MRPLDYILKNKQWIFDGIGVFFLGGFVWLIRRLFFRHSPNVREETAEPSRSPNLHKSGDPLDISVPQEWQAILPPETRYGFKSEKRTAIPLGLQSFSFEYAPRGHASPLILKSRTVRAEIEFKCRITNVVKACYAANDFALNVLQPKFLIEARRILEAYSLSKLRASREEVSRKILIALSPEFEQHGVHLESVSLGALERISSAKDR